MNKVVDLFPSQVSQGGDLINAFQAFQQERNKVMRNKNSLSSKHIQILKKYYESKLKLLSILLYWSSLYAILVPHHQVSHCTTYVPNSPRNNPRNQASSGKASCFYQIKGSLAVN